jgi:hypothetical protein
MQPKIKRIFALAFIVTFLATIPLVFAETPQNNKSDLIKVVYELKVNVNDVKPSGGGSSGAGLYTLIAKGLYNHPADLYYKASSEDNTFYLAIQNSIIEYNKYHTLFTGTITLDDAINVDANTVTNPVDGKNELLFDNLGDSGTIAQTTAWISRGSRLIVDFDIVFNTYYDWDNPGDTSNTAYAVSLMDTQSIVTHELGHGVGLGDLYKTSAFWQTMYGFSDFGQTWKRTLEAGDIAGLKALYG